MSFVGRVFADNTAVTTHGYNRELEAKKNCEQTTISFSHHFG